MDHYFDTAKRMCKSSKTLHDNDEYHNACYMAGYVIECYAKIIVCLSYGFTPNDMIEFRHNLRRLDTELQYILNQSSPFSSYIVDMREDFSKILRGQRKWDPNKRYFANNVAFSNQNSIDYQAEITAAMTILTQMSIDTSSNLI
jgi:hypothetical protein